MDGVDSRHPAARPGSLADWHARGRPSAKVPAGILEGDDLDITYDVVAGESLLVIEEGEQVEGSLRFISDNPKGSNKNYFWPYVRIQPTGDFAVKGEQWQVISFNFAVLTPKDGRKRVYVRAV